MLRTCARSLESLHFGEERERVHPFGGRIADDETALTVLMFQQVLGSLAGHVAHVPTGRKK